MDKTDIKILIVEDSAVDTLVLNKSLIEMGYSVIGKSKSGEDAIIMSDNLKPDLILMDIELEGQLSGIEASGEIIKKHNIPIIFTTGHSDSKTLEQVKNQSPYGFIIKPYDKKNLFITIEIAVKRHEFDKKIEESEKKYRLLVEGTNDIIFTLDENWKFLTINKAIVRTLNIPIEDALGRSFFDVLFENDTNLTTGKKLILEKFEQFKKDKKPLNFKALFKSSISSEPKELQVKLEYLNITGKNEVLGKASKAIEDTLIKYFKSEKLIYQMENYLVSAEDVSYRVTRNLEKYMDQKEVNLLRIAVREMIINSIEHGNLNITFEEKTISLDDESYIELLSQRQKNSDHMKKKVTIEYSLNSERVVYKISDEGNGFDYKKIIKNINDVNKNYISHGRGINMAMNIFDEITFNKKGNQVLMIKKLKK